MYLQNIKNRKLIFITDYSSKWFKIFHANSLGIKQGAELAETLRWKIIREALRQAPLKSSSEQIPLYKIAADQGDVFAQYQLGLLYENGTDTTLPDLDKATEYFSRATIQGNPTAQSKLF